MSTTLSPTAAAQSLNVFDSEGLASLRYQARSDDPKTNRAVAQQFEALIVQQMIKSMREAVPRQGLFDSEQSRLYESLLDQQLAQNIAAQKGLGLADLIEQQLNFNPPVPNPPENGVTLHPAPAEVPLDGFAKPVPLNGATQAVGLPASSTGNVAGSTTQASEARVNRPVQSEASGPRAFAQSVWPAAVESSRVTGIPPAFLVAQAALESGWGQSQPRLADGRPSYNLFGIKAGANWNGPVVEAVTTEYIDGQMQRRVERFRAYGSYAEAFADHARLLSSAPRYAAVLGSQDAASFAQGLQKAGYATDPNYAVKLQRIIGGETLRSALIG